MSRKIDVSKASDWSEEEAWFNVRHLEDRNKWSEAKKVREAAGLPATGYPVDPNAFTPDSHQQTTSLGGTKPGAVVTEKSADEGEEDNAPNRGTVTEVLERVGEDKELAKEALEAEEASENPRSTLVDELETLLEEE